MKYEIGTLVYVKTKRKNHGFLSYPGEIIYFDPRQQLYTVRFPKDKIAYFSEYEITPVTKWKKTLSKKLKKPSLKQSSSVISILLFIGLSLASPYVNFIRPSIIPTASNSNANQPTTTTTPEQVPYSPISPSARDLSKNDNKPSVQISQVSASVNANSFIVTGQLVNRGSVATFSNKVTVVIVGRQGQEIGRQQADLGTISAQSSKVFSVPFAVDPSTVGSYKVSANAQYWRSFKWSWGSGFRRWFS